MAEVDYEDPCAVLAILRPAYYALIAGSKEETVEFEAGNGSRRRVTFHRTKLADLKSEIGQLEVKCEAKNGKVRRFGLRAGGY